MARTKQACHPVDSINVGQITIVNESSQQFWSNVMNRNARNREVGHGSRINVMPQSRSVVPLVTYREDPVVSWTIHICNYGLLCLDDSNEPSSPLSGRIVASPFTDGAKVVEIDISPGGMYRLVDDPQNQHLTEVQFSTITLSIIKMLQESSPYPNIWDKMVTSLPTDLVAGRNAVNLSRAYETSRFREDFRFPSWQNFYHAVRLKLHCVDLDTINRSLVEGGAARIDVYWRALDRNPRSYTDQHTICYTFDCTTLSVSTRTVQNKRDSDVNNGLFRCEYRPANLSIKVASKDPDGPFHSFLKALKALGRGESECTILDLVSRDATAYDTPWTSQEILVSLPMQWNANANHQFPQSYRESIRQVLMANNRLGVMFPIGVMHQIFEYAAPRQYLPVARLHQRCIIGPQYDYFSSNDLFDWADRTDPEWVEDLVLPAVQEVEIQPTDVQSRVLQTVEELVGMGRVRFWGDDDEGNPPYDACPARQDRRLDTMHDSTSLLIASSAGVRFGPSTSGVLHPFYFNFPARNCVSSDVVSGTSREWGNRT